MALELGSGRVPGLTRSVKPLGGRNGPLRATARTPVQDQDLYLDEDIRKISLEIFGIISAIIDSVPELIDSIQNSELVQEILSCLSKIKDPINNGVLIVINPIHD